MTKKRRHFDCFFFYQVKEVDLITFAVHIGDITQIVYKKKGRRLEGILYLGAF